MKLVMHIGAHKTASTTYQQVMTKNEDVFRQHNIAVVPKRFTVNGKEIYKTDPRFSSYKPSKYRPAYKELAEHFSGADCAIISDEGLVGPFPATSRKFYPEPGEKSAQIAEALGADDVSIILTVRRQDTFYESCFKHAYQIAAGVPLEQLLVELPVEDISWLRLAQELARQFGEDKVFVRPYEVLRTERPEVELSNLLGKVLGHDIELVDSGKRVSNRSIDRRGREVSAALPHDIPHKIRLEIVAVMRRNSSTDPDPILPPLFRDAILRHHAEDNKELFYRFLSDCDAAEMGYLG